MMRVLLAILVLTTVQVCAKWPRLPSTPNNLATCGSDAVGQKPSDVQIISPVPSAPDQFWRPPPIFVKGPIGHIFYKRLEEEYTKLYGVPFNSTLTTFDPQSDVQYSREPISTELLIDSRLANRNVTNPDAIITTYGDAARELVRLNNLLNCDMDMVLGWMKLPEYYHPPYIVSGRCVTPPQTCGYPPDAGYKCQPDTVNTLLVDVIRWDCCYVMIDRWWMRHCGWRHVKVHSIIHCSCSCSRVVS